MGFSSGLGLKAGAMWGQGDMARGAADATAAQYDAAATAAVQASTVAAADAEKRSRLLQSRALAVAAAGGTDATSSGVMKIISEIAGEGEYRSLLTRYEGQEKARGLRQRADATRYEGQVAERTARLGAVSTLISGGKSMYEKYGQGGPGGSATDDGSSQDWRSY